MVNLVWAICARNYSITIGRLPEPALLYTTIIAINNISFLYEDYEKVFITTLIN